MLLALSILLAGCGLTQSRLKLGPVAEMLPDLPDTCGVDKTSDLLGQDFVLLADRPFVGQLRVIWPGQEVTADIVTTRLNATVTTEGRIIKVFCG